MDFLISDLHLHQGQKFVPDLFLHFIKNIAPESENLYVLGDLFEYWIGDDFISEFNQTIIQSFREYSDSGRKLFFIHGNRDFLLGDEFIKSTGGTLLNEFTVTKIGSLPTLLMHGDTLCSKDKDYLTFRKQVRDQAWQQQFLSQSLKTRKSLAEKLRDDSMADQKNKSEEILDVTPEEVERCFSKYQVDRLIHGHTHRQFHHQFTFSGKAVERIVLGDWGKWGNYCRCEGNRAELIDFTI